MKPSLHHTWYEALSAVQDLGLARDLTARYLFGQLGVFAARPMDPDLMAEVLHAYYRGEGEASTLLRLRRTEGYCAVQLGERMNAMLWLARLIGAAPVLRGTTVARRPFASLQGAGRLQRIATHHGWAELADVVDAANAMLAPRCGERFVPLLSTHLTEAYLLTDRECAEVLTGLGLLEPDWEHAFATPTVAQAA